MSNAAFIAFLPAICYSKRMERLRSCCLADKILCLVKDTYSNFLMVLKVRILSGRSCFQNDNAVGSTGKRNFLESGLSESQMEEMLWVFCFQKIFKYNRSYDEQRQIHADVLFPHDIVHSYRASSEVKADRSGIHVIRHIQPLDTTLEELWRSLPDYVQGTGNTLCIADGSSSMLSRIGKTNLS